MTQKVPFIGTAQQCKRQNHENTSKRTQMLINIFSENTFDHSGMCFGGRKKKTKTNLN